jgi:hypothetical protein
MDFDRFFAEIWSLSQPPLPIGINKYTESIPRRHDCRPVLPKSRVTFIHEQGKVELGYQHNRPAKFETSEYNKCIGENILKVRQRTTEFYESLFYESQNEPDQENKSEVTTKIRDKDNELEQTTTEEAGLKYDVNSKLIYLPEQEEQVNQERRNSDFVDQLLDAETGRIHQDEEKLKRKPVPPVKFDTSFLPQADANNNNALPKIQAKSTQNDHSRDSTSRYPLSILPTENQNLLPWIQVKDQKEIDFSQKISKTGGNTLKKPTFHLYDGSFAKYGFVAAGGELIAYKENKVITEKQTDYLRKRTQKREASRRRDVELLNVGANELPSLSYQPNIHEKDLYKDEVSLNIFSPLVHRAASPLILEHSIKVTEIPKLSFEVYDTEINSNM